MGLDLSGLGTLLRRGADDVGSFFTGQPAQSNPTSAPAPSQPSQPAPIQQSSYQPPSFNPQHIAGGLPSFMTPPPIGQKPDTAFQQRVSSLNQQPQTNFDKSAENFLNPIGNAIGGLAQGIAQPAELIGRALYDAGREGAAAVTQNPVAMDNAKKSLDTVSNQSIDFGKGVAQFIPRAIAQTGMSLAATVDNHPTDNVITPQGGFQKAIFGNQPIQSFQNTYKTNAQTGGAASGVGNVIANVGGDALALLGAKSAGEHGIKIANNVIDYTKPLDQAGGISNKPTPLPADAPQELHDMYNKLSGTAADTNPSSIKLSQDEALPRSQRSGIALSSPDTIPTPGANLSDAEITRLRQAGVDDTVNRSIAGQNMAELNDKQLREITLQGGRESSNVQTNIAQRSKLVNAAIDRGVSGGEDRLFTEAVEHPEKVQDILTQVKKPQQFYQALVEAKNFSDFAHDATVKSGIPLGYVENHLHHNIDLSSPEQQAKFDEISQVRGKNATPGYAKERVFSDLNDVERNGFNLKYSKAKDIYTDYANSVKNSVGNQTLLNYLSEHANGHIGDVQDAGGRIPTDANGGKFTTGRSNSLQTQFLSPQLADQVHKYIEPIKLGSIAKGIDTVGQTLKQATLALGGFHDINVSKRYITQELASGLIGEPKRLLNVVLNSAKQDVAFWSSKYYDHELGKARNTGLLDRATESGLTLNKNLDVGSLDKNINIAAKDNKVIDLHKNSDGSFGVNRTKDAVNTAKDVGKKIIMAPKHVNEFLHEFLFGRKIPLMKLQTLESEMNRYSIPLKGELTDVQKTKLTALADQTNNMYGGVTKGLILKTGMGKYIQRQLLLAPDFSSGNMNSVVNMAHGDAKSLAWRQNMGNYLTTMVGAAVATGLIAQFTGQDGKQEAIDKIKKEFTPSSGTFLQPSVDLPYKDANGNKLVAKLPSSPVEEGIKAVSDPSHYIISRVGSAPRNAYSFATNKAYNGDLVDPYSNPNPSNADKLKATAATNLPIPAAQGIRLNNGQQNVATTVLNTGGLRVTKDPTDPNVQRGNQYYKTYTNFVNSLTPNDKAALQVVQPTKKDRSGNYVMPPTVFDTPDKAETLLRFPNVLTGLTKMNQDLQSQGQTIDPFYNLSPDQQQSALVHDTINKNNTQQLTDFSQKNAWYSQFQTDRSVYFNSLPPGDPNRPKLPFSPPVQSDQVKQAYTQLNTLSDPKDRSQFYAAHPELTQYQQDEAKYTNQILTAQHFTPLKLPPTADKDTAAYMQTYFAASKDQRNVMRTGNPGGFQNMNAYLQNQSEYEVAKNGALDQLQGQTPNQKLLKGINSLATYDMVKNPDGSLALKYGSVNPGATSYGSVSATPQAGAVSTAGSGSGSGSGSYHFQKKIKAPHFKRIKLRNPHEHRLRTSKSLKLKTPNSPIPSQSHGSIKIKKVMV